VPASDLTTNRRRAIFPAMGPISVVLDAGAATPRAGRLDLQRGVDYSGAAMSRDDEAKNVRLFDRRVVERNIKKGLVTRKDYEKHLKSLSDVAANIASPDERIEEAPEPPDDEGPDETPAA